VSKILTVKITAADGTTFEAHGDSEAVDAQVKQFRELWNRDDVSPRSRSPNAPSTHYDAIVIVLHRAKRPLSHEEIRAALTEAGFRIPRKLAQTLADTARKAKGKKYIENPERGSWTLTAEGRDRARILERTFSSKRNT
jgi:hypothetical protein